MTRTFNDFVELSTNACRLYGNQYEIWTTFGGSAKRKNSKKSEITMEVGGWVQVSLEFFFFGKSSQNSPKPVVIFWSSIPCVFCLHMHC